MEIVFMRIFRFISEYDKIDVNEDKPTRGLSPEHKT
jgi:hypothetical protein